ncbi:MAG TPA: hypothetical protein VD997_11880 [Phycisphaerales bacterium]|nr:hypothetical protein [Phycisphaerales bacterium]
MTTTLKLTTLAALITLTASAGAAIVGEPVTVRVQSSLGQASFTVLLPQGTYNPAAGTFSYSLPSSIDLIDTSNGRTIAILDGLTVGFQEDGFGQIPRTALGFALRAGNANTSISIFSAHNTLSPLSRTAAGIASMTLTDLGGAPGASMVGNMMTEWWFEGRLGDLIFVGWDGQTAGPGLTSNQTITCPVVPPFGISELFSQYGFDLSANDSASGTSLLRAVPTPGAVSLLALAGLATTRRRR